MNKFLAILLAALFCADVASAQPAARRREKAQQQQQKDQGLSVRAQISFPTQKAMDEDVTWRRDIYREIDLTEDANAGLYYPVEPVGSQVRRRLGRPRPAPGSERPEDAVADASPFQRR